MAAIASAGRSRQPDRMTNASRRGAEPATMPVSENTSAVRLPVVGTAAMSKYMFSVMIGNLLIGQGRHVSVLMLAAGSNSRSNHRG